MNRFCLVAGLGMVVLVGCAVGSAVNPTTSELATTPVEAGTEDDASLKLAPPTTTPTDDTDADAGDASPPAKDAGVDSGPPPPPPPPPPTCNAPNTCQAATDLGYLSGDLNSDTAQASGSTSQWFTVRVGEDDASFFANSLEAKAILISPPGTNYDLYVYVPGTDTRECAAVTTQSTSGSGTDQAGVEFGESGTFANGGDDDRTVTIEVRYVSGPCNPATKWTLNLYGNQH